MWGSDYHFTNYNFRTTFSLSEQPLPEGWNSMFCL